MQRRRPNRSEPNPPSIHSLNIASRPAAVSGSGGIRKVASARIIDSKARKSADSLASTYFFSRSRSAALPSTLAGHGGLRDGSSRSLTRARCKALQDDGPPHVRCNLADISEPLEHWLSLLLSSGGRIGTSTTHRAPIRYACRRGYVGNGTSGAGKSEGRNRCS